MAATNDKNDGGNNWMFLDRFHNLHRFDALLELETPLAVGTGREDPLTDMPVHWDLHRQAPFIPGSSFKGAFRSQVETMAVDLGIEACLLFGGGTSTRCISLQRPSARDPKLEMFRGEPDDGKRRRMIERGDIIICPPCQLFGSPAMASRVVFEDLFPTEKSIKDLEARVDDWEAYEDHLQGGKKTKTSLWNRRHKLAKVRHGVGIDRTRGAAAEGIKYDYEALHRGLVFQMTIIGRNLRPMDLGLLAVGFELLRRGEFTVGGKVSRGLGRLQMVHFKHFERSGPEGLKAYLLQGWGDPRVSKACKGTPQDEICKQLTTWIEALLQGAATTPVADGEEGR